MIRVVTLHPGFLTIVIARGEGGGDLVIPLSYPDAKELMTQLAIALPEKKS